MSPRKKTFCNGLGRARVRAMLPWIASAAFGLTACTEPPIDENTPPPAGVMEGTVTYFGPRPTCDYENGGPVSVRGRVILTLFHFGNPPPPEGSATSALNLLAIPGSALFADLDAFCAPEGVPPDPNDTISSSVDFIWPELPLGDDQPVAYRVQGFFDQDESFNPFFNITQPPTADDVAGAALVDATSDTPEIRPIVFGTEAENPLGEIVSNVSVTLGLHVVTEPPVFYATSEHLASSTPLRPSTSGPAANEERLLLTMPDTRLHLYADLTAGPGLELQQALDAAALDFDIGPGRAEYAWYVREVDVDGVPGVDPHPVLGSESIGLKYYFPAVLLRRRQNELEAKSGVPTVVMTALLPQNSTSVMATPYADGQVVFPELRVVVPPVAIAITNPELGNVCRIPFFAPGTATEAYVYLPSRAPRLADCQELPTGRYDFTVLNGVTDGAVVEDMGSPTGFNITGGRYSNQNWTSPNALGDPAQFVARGEPIPASCAESPCATEQSVTSAFLVYDATPDANDYVARRTGHSECVNTTNVFEQPDTVPTATWDEATINAFVASDPDDAFESAQQVAEACCEPIEHLCDVPLCPLEPDPNAPDHQIYGAPTSVTEIDWNGEPRQRPNCVSFLMPTPCCPNPPQP